MRALSQRRPACALLAPSSSASDRRGETAGSTLTSCAPPSASSAEGRIATSISLAAKSIPPSRPQLAAHSISTYTIQGAVLSPNAALIGGPRYVSEYALPPLETALNTPPLARPRSHPRPTVPLSRAPFSQHFHNQPRARSHAPATHTHRQTAGRRRNGRCLQGQVEGQAVRQGAGRRLSPRGPQAQDADVLQAGCRRKRVRARRVLPAVPLQPPAMHHADRNPLASSSPPPSGHKPRSRPKPPQPPFSTLQAGQRSTSSARNGGLPRTMYSTARRARTGA
jgi:hypothetical protein